MGLIYHIAARADWEQAQVNGEYRVATLARTLEEQGFIHGATAEQVTGVANTIYAGHRGLLLLVIDEDRVVSEIAYEAVPGWEQHFPHIYGPLNINAVVATLPLDPGIDGRFSFVR